MSIAAQVKALGTREKLAADPLLGPHANALGPMLNNVSTKARTKTRTLGKGTYGRVNLERINNTGNVATKYFLAPGNEDSDDFIHEIAAMRYLRGLPNVAQLVGIAPAKGYEQPFPAAIMAKAKTSLANSSLYTKWSDVHNIILQLIRGFYVMHERRLAHRDIKPANMLLTDLGEVYISDFGATKYITAGTPNDAYTGTMVYASPELLMIYSLRNYNKVNVNWFAHDAWAIGNTLYEIVTLERFSYPDRIVTHDSILSLMYSTYGTPTEADGQVYTLFTEYKAKKAPALAETPKISIKDRIIAKARVKPDDPKELEQVAELIASLLNYNPEKRPTMRALLDLPFMGGAPYMDPLPALTVTEYTLPADLNIRMYKILTGWLYEVQKKYAGSGIRDTITTRMIVLDRTCAYLLEILDAARKAANPDFAKTSNLQAVGCLALYIAEALVGGPYGFEMREFYNLTVRTYTVATLRKFLNTIMTYDIPFYGKTFYDELLEATEDPDMRWKLGLLNAICYQKNYFKHVPKEQLKELMMTHAGLITERPDALSLDKGYDMFKPFIDAADAVVAPASAAPAPIAVVPASAVPAPAPAPVPVSALVKGPKVTNPKDLIVGKTYCVGIAFDSEECTIAKMLEPIEMTVRAKKIILYRFENINNRNSHPMELTWSALDIYEAVPASGGRKARNITKKTTRKYRRTTRRYRR